MSAIKTFPIESKDDHISKDTQATPLGAIAELVWNSLDADATSVDIKEDNFEFGQSRIIVSDNGHGFSHFEAETLFGSLGGSWKRWSGQSKGAGRFLHGAEGKGRLKALALGNVVDWEVQHKDKDEYYKFTVSMLNSDIKNVRVTAAEMSELKSTGVRCVISELHKSYEFLHSIRFSQELTEIFATYLKNYSEIQITTPAGKLDITTAIEASSIIPLKIIVKDGVEYPVELEIIEWKRSSTGRILYFCNESGLPLSQIDIRIQVPGLNFSAYLKSSYISKLSHDGTLDFGELNSDLADLIVEAKSAIKVFYRERIAEKSQTVVEKWKEESIYPFTNEPVTQVERIEREVFDIVAVKVSDLLPDFDDSPQKGKKFQLRMLKQAIEQSPEDLQLILTEVLDLTEKSQKEFAQLLQQTSLTAIISASKVVANRLKFLAALESLLFSKGEKEHLKERSQLHRLLAENTWIFGEEFFLSVDDQSLTEVLRQHLETCKLSMIVNEPVKRIDGKVGIIDLMLTRKIPCHRPNESEHLVVELKRPAVKITSKEITQIKDYAFAVADDERFLGIDTRWTFWIISTDMDAVARIESKQANRPDGILFQSEDKKITIWAKTWSEVLEANKQRLRLFQESLEFNADKESSLKSLKETHSNLFGNVEILDFESGDLTEIEENAESA